MEEQKRHLRKERVGVVSSNKCDKTITVEIKWKEKHPIYGKFVNKTKKYHAHDEKNEQWSQGSTLHPRVGRHRTPLCERRRHDRGDRKEHHTVVGG